MNFVVSFLSNSARLSALVLLLGGCAFHPMTPRGVSDIGDILPFGSQTTPAIVQASTPASATSPAKHQTLLSPGDSIKLSIFGDEHFSGYYVIVEVVEWAPAQVSVAGAVYQPGQVVINQYNLKPESRSPELRSGAATVKRFVQDAILAAGGLRPDADLNNIRIHRGEQQYKISLLEFFNGTAVADIGLISGDRLVVGSIGVFQEPLATQAPQWAAIQHAFLPARA